MACPINSTTGINNNVNAAINHGPMAGINTGIRISGTTMVMITTVTTIMMSKAHARLTLQNKKHERTEYSVVITRSARANRARGRVISAEPRKVQSDTTNQQSCHANMRSKASLYLGPEIGAGKPFRKYWTIL